MIRYSTLAMTAGAGLLALTSAAFAADSGAASDGNDKTLVASSDWYVSGTAGLTFLQQASNRSATLNFNSSYSNPGYAFTGAIGRELGYGFRAEGEVGYREIGVDHVSGITGAPTGSASGSTGALSFMANGYYDFETNSPIKPYIGGGLGLARVTMSGVGVNGVGLVNDSDLDFAYQAMGGIGYQVGERGTIFTEYRYFATEDPEFTANDGQRFRSQLADHTVEVGYRLRF